MLIFCDLSMRPTEEVNKVKDGIILDEEESKIFDMAIRNKSAQEMAFVIHKSPRTIYREMNRIRTKILNYYNYKQSVIS